MKRLLILPAFALAFLVFSGCDSSTLTSTEEDAFENESASLAFSKNGGHAKATGDISWIGGDGLTRSATFNAHDSEGAPGRQIDRGDVYYSFDGGTFELNVECVNVISENEALFGGHVTNGSGQFNEGDWFRFRVTDGGPGQKGDTFRANESGNCLAVEAGQFPNITNFDVISGNLVVHN